MKKILYKDQPFYVDIGLSPTYTTIQSYIRVYVVRTNFWKFIKKYKLVSRAENQGEAYVTSRAALKKHLEAAYQSASFKQNEVMDCIECSPEIEMIYRNR